jgi:hypothetical protein
VNEKVRVLKDRLYSRERKKKSIRNHKRGNSTAENSGEKQRQETTCNTNSVPR